MDAVQANLVNENEVQRLFAQVKSPVQILIVNHAIYEAQDVPLVDMELSQWQRTMDVNLTSAFLVVRAFLRQLRETPEELRREANVILIGSTAGRFGEADHADYSASKSGEVTSVVRDNCTDRSSSPHVRLYSVSQE